MLFRGFDRDRFGCINQPGAGSLNLSNARGCVAEALRADDAVRSQWLRGFLLVGMPIRFVLPGFACFEGIFAFKIGEALNSLAFLPRETEIDILELVVEADFAGVLEPGTEIDTINSRPINGTHAHWTGGAIDEEVAPLEHLRALRHGIGRARWPWNHPEVAFVMV